MGQAFSALMLCPYCIYSAVLPALFTKEVTNKEATEGKSVSLRCELNKAAANVEWKKGFKTLKPSDKYKMKREGVVAELVIQNLDTTDAGNYSCVCGDQQTTAVLTVHGKTNKMRHRTKSNYPVFSVHLDRYPVTRLSPSFCQTFIRSSLMPMKFPLVSVQPGCWAKGRFPRKSSEKQIHNLDRHYCFN